MKKSFHPGLNRHVYEVFAGEYHASREKNIVFTTLLGSCISACLKDVYSGVTGINHFMLPGHLEDNRSDPARDDGRYGLYAMEKLLEEMVGLGAQKAYLQAKVFGGGEVLDVSLNNVARMNVEFILSFLETKKIPLVASDIGNKFGRKLFFYGDTFDVYVKRIEMDKTLEAAVAREKRFMEWVKRHKLTGKKAVVDVKKEVR